MPRKPSEHPAYAAMLAQSAAHKLPHRFMTDLTVHDSKRLEVSPREQPFVWALYRNGTHMAEPAYAVKHKWTVRFEPDDWARFYLWDGVALQDLGTDGVQAQGKIARFVEREAERAAELAARYCQSNPRTPHEWRNGRCSFCEVSQPKPEVTP